MEHIMATLCLKQNNISDTKSTGITGFQNCLIPPVADERPHTHARNRENSLMPIFQHGEKRLEQFKRMNARLLFVFVHIRYRFIYRL